MVEREFPDIGPVDPKDLDHAGVVLAAAFLEDPQWVALLDDPEVRRRILPQVFSTAAAMTAAAGGMIEGTRGLEVVAMWLPPGKDIGAWAFVRSGFAPLHWVARTPMPSVQRITSVMQQIDERHKILMPHPHWYLMAVGVHPEHRGGGLGSLAIRRGLQRADDEQKPVFLETETEANVGFYEHLGFEVLEKMAVPEIDVPFWLMARSPRPPDKPT